MSIATNVLATIIAAVLLQLSWVVSTRVFVPWLRHVIGGGLDLSGEWRINFTNNGRQSSVGTASVRHKLGKIIGSMHLTKGRTGKRIARRFKTEGDCSAGLIIMRYCDVEMPQYIFGVAMLKVADDGKSMVGQVMYLEHELNEVVAYGLRLTKD